MRVRILNKDRSVTTKKANPNKSDFEFRKSLYILSPDRIQNYRNDRGYHKDSEIIFFEDNPNGLSGAVEPEDKSKSYLDDVVKINFIQQATDTFGKWDLPRINLGWLFDNPERIPLILLVGAILWVVVRNYLGG